jgi:glycosyltransferase involved in cell wall biosynthesis
MASRRPVVAARGGGGPAEYLHAEVNCLQFAPGDAAGLAAAVRRLAADEPLRRTLVRAGAGTAAQHTEQDFHRAVLAELEAAVVAGGQG